MTELKKRFQKLVPEHFGGMQHDLMASCEIIAQKFAIDFAEWVRTNAYDTGEKWYYQEDNETYTTEELLEIYKKQLT